MALARGETLEQRLARDGNLPAQIVERLFVRLLDGLQEVHKAGFLHRDIKPANIILDWRDDPTLIDFGAARASIAGRTAAMTSVYTPRYAATEQFTSDRQGPWTDIYCLSATIYHTITGRTPPPSVQRALDDLYEPLLECAPAGFARALLTGIDAGLAVRVKDRPQSIESWCLSLIESSDAGDSAIRMGAGGRTGGVATSPLASEPQSTTRRGAPRPSTALGPAIGIQRSAMANTPRFSSMRILRYGGAVLVAALLGIDGMWALTPISAFDVKRVTQNATIEAEAQARQRAEVEARQKVEAEARQKAEAEARQKAEDNRKSEEQKRQQAAVAPLARPAEPRETPTNCYNSADLTTIRVRMLQMELNVMTLQCLNGGSRIYEPQYRDILAKFQNELAGNGNNLRQLGGSKRFNVDALVTEIANRTARKAPADREFCSRAKRTLDWALSPQVTTMVQVPPPYDLSADMNIVPCSPR